MWAHCVAVSVCRFPGATAYSLGCAVNAMLQLLAALRLVPVQFAQVLYAVLATCVALGGSWLERRLGAACRSRDCADITVTNAPVSIDMRAWRPVAMYDADLQELYCKGTGLLWLLGAVLDTRQQGGKPGAALVHVTAVAVVLSLGLLLTG